MEINKRAELEKEVISLMTDSKWYERRNIILDMNIEWTYHTVDLAIVDYPQKKLIWVVELKVFKNDDESAEKMKTRLKESQKIFAWRYEGLKIFFVVYTTNNRTTKFLTLNVDSYEEDIEYKSLDDFPTYQELIAHTKVEETRGIKKNYKHFKCRSRILWGLSLMLFLGSIFHVEIYIAWRTQYKIFYTLNIDYPNIILFGISIILILIPFLQKIETLRFKIDLTEENNK